MKKQITFTLPPKNYSSGTQEIIIADSSTPVSNNDRLVASEAVDKESFSTLSKKGVTVYQNLFDPSVATPLSRLGTTEVRIANNNGTTIAVTVGLIKRDFGVSGFSPWSLTSSVGEVTYMMFFPDRLLHKNHIFSERADLSSLALGFVFFSAGFRIEYGSGEKAFGRIVIKKYGFKRKN